MKGIGVCFGGYCPLHQGHLDVIMRAKKENDICYVIVCGYDDEPRGWEINLNHDERFELIEDFFRGDEQIRVRKINDTELGIDQSMSEHNWKVWMDRAHQIIVEDEDTKDLPIMWYVAEPFYRTNILKNVGPLESCMLCEKHNNVSGTLIRSNPVKYWNKIAEPFKQYLTKNILIIGTASEGKSTLVRDISAYFGIPYADEYGRRYMEYNEMQDTDLLYPDFEKFIEEQNFNCEVNAAITGNGVFIADTDNTVTLMYADAYAEDPDIEFSHEDLERLHAYAKEKNTIKWDKIFILPPSKDFVDDGSRYMKQSSMDERWKNFDRLQKYVNEFYPEVSRTYLNGTFYENFIEVKRYIQSLPEN